MLRRREDLQKLHRYKGTHESCTLNRLRQDIAQMSIEMLLVMGGEMQLLVTTGFGITLNSFHQFPTITLSTKSLGDHHCLYK